VEGRGEQTTDRRGFNLAGLAALAAVITAAVLVGLLLFGGSSEYKVRARFLNAAQLVKGNVVDIGGTNGGLVKDFRLSPEGHAEVDLEIDEKYAPLRRGTRAAIRAAGQTSTAGRYVQLMLPPEKDAGGDIPDGGLIDVDRTSTNVDIDQFFNIFDRRTRLAIRRFYEGGSRQYAGRGRQANRGFAYLNPQLASSTRFFKELRYDDQALERFLVDSERFVTALSEREDDLTQLISNANSTTRALGDQKAALAEVVERFPPFMRQANTTFVNLRATLDELDPFVEASKPVARKTRPYLAELRPFAREAVPTIRDASALIRRRGRDNDVIELNRTYPPLADMAVSRQRRRIDFGTGARDLGERRGAFPEMSQALRDSAPIVAHGRPYAVDLAAWFDGFSHTGAYDALGSFARVQTYANAFTLSNGVPVGDIIPPDQRAQVFRNTARLRQVKRCPGHSEEPAADGTNVWSEEEQKELDCRESDRAVGPTR
jgi:phospholipid/cholesterol/gamma-HCH transport system substrate-binding protein